MVVTTLQAVSGAGNPAIQIHGPGFSKILIGDDEIENWPGYVDLMVASIAENGGRSCINASAVVVPKYAPQIAEALARKLGPIQPARSDDDNARLSGFANVLLTEPLDYVTFVDLMRRSSMPRFAAVSARISHASISFGFSRVASRLSR